MKLNLAELKNFKLVTLECNIERTNNPFLMVCFNKKNTPQNNAAAPLSFLNVTLTRELTTWGLTWKGISPPQLLIIPL